MPPPRYLTIFMLILQCPSDALLVLSISDKGYTTCLLQSPVWDMNIVNLPCNAPEVGEHPDAAGP